MLTEGGWRVCTKVCISIQWWRTGWSMPTCSASRTGWLRIKSPCWRCCTRWPPVRSTWRREGDSTSSSCLYNRSAFVFIATLLSSCGIRCCFTLFPLGCFRVQTCLLARSWRKWRSAVQWLQKLWNSGPLPPSVLHCSNTKSNICWITGSSTDLLVLTLYYVKKMQSMLLMTADLSPSPLLFHWNEGEQ